MPTSTTSIGWELPRDSEYRLERRVSSFSLSLALSLPPPHPPPPHPLSLHYGCSHTICPPHTKQTLKATHTQEDSPDMEGCEHTVGAASICPYQYSSLIRTQHHQHTNSARSTTNTQTHQHTNTAVNVPPTFYSLVLLLSFLVIFVCLFGFGRGEGGLFGG